MLPVIPSRRFLQNPPRLIGFRPTQGGPAMTRNMVSRTILSGARD